MLPGLYEQTHTAEIQIHELAILLRCPEESQIAYDPLPTGEVYITVGWFNPGMDWRAAPTGNGLELQVLAAAVIGSASLRGGEGTVLDAFLAVVFVALINNAMTMLAVSIYWQMIVIGGVLVSAVALDMLIRSKRS